jgi:hypothetical protein
MNWRYLLRLLVALLVVVGLGLVSQASFWPPT